VLWTLGAVTATVQAMPESSSMDQLEAKVERLEAELEQAQQDLAQARAAAKQAGSLADSYREDLASERAKIRLGPVTVGGAVRVNYIYGSYEGYDDGPNRGGHGGNVELDTFRLNLALEYGKLIGALEYRWYTADTGTNYNFAHTAWLGYRFDTESQVQLGLNRVPFGPGPYGLSQSWFFDQHYYVGLADDPDLGIKYKTRLGDWALDVAYYPRNEPSFSGRSLDSTRYGYDAVLWNGAVDDTGKTYFDQPANGYQERDQFNFRAIYHYTGENLTSELGMSFQYGDLKGKRVDNGDHWAVSAHAVTHWQGLTLGTQLTRYRFDIDSKNPWGSQELIPMGAYDFAWPVATDAWIPALSLSYRIPTDSLAWLDYIKPYFEWSGIVKEQSKLNNSQLITLGSGWARGNWYIYSDLVYSNGNLFVGNKGDDYSRIDGVGDFGVAGNDTWNYRFNLNFGYYF
jgi:hypothetical protein